MYNNRMIELNIPGRGSLQLAHLVSDVNGTLAVDGQLLDGLSRRLAALRDRLTLHLHTAVQCALTSTVRTGASMSRLSRISSRMFILKTLHKFGATRCFFHQHLSHQVADTDDLWISDLIDDILRVALSDDNASVAQHAEVPGDRRLRVAGDTRNLAYPLRSIPQNVDDFDPCCAGHTPANISLDFENRPLRHITLPSPSPGPFGKR